MVATRRALEKYADMDPTFPSTREYQLLVDLADQVEAGDQDVFAGTLSKPIRGFTIRKLSLDPKTFYTADSLLQKNYSSTIKHLN